MAAKKKAEPVVSQPLTSQAASTTARATEPNADDVQSSQAPTEVQTTIPIAPTPDEGPSSQSPAVHVTIPIDSYPDVDEPYLHSFELLRSNVYEAVFSLGRLANAFRFSQFLFHYRMFGGEIGVPHDFFACINDCLDLLDRETQSAIVNLLRNYINRPKHTPGQNEPIEYESWWDDVSCGEPTGVPFFRLPLSELYEFSLNTRAKAPVNTESQDFSGWLDCFEALYENIRQGDQHLADWMMAGWNVDRLVRPEMDTNLLRTYYDDPPPPSPYGEKPILPATNPRQFDSTRALCGVGGYSTRDPVSRHASARLIFLTLSSQTIALEPPQTSEEFESFVSYWVRRSAVLNPPGDSGQKLLPANLRKTQGLYVFCGRIWKHYRDESNKNSSNSTDGTAAKKPKIADSFEIAIENGWNKDEDLFIKYAKEGVKTGKPWSDFVNGTKGKNVPLGKFLT